MNIMPQVIPISDLRNDHKKVLALSAKSPIILAQHSRSAAVLMSIEEWDRMARRMIELEDYILSQRRQQEMDNGLFVTQQGLEEQLLQNDVVLTNEELSLRTEDSSL